MVILFTGKSLGSTLTDTIILSSFYGGVEMKRKPLFLSLALTLALSSSVPAAAYLQNVYSRAVKTGQSVRTMIDSFNVDMSANSGVAVSKYTLVLTPQSSVTYLKTAPAIRVDTVVVDGKYDVPSVTTIVETPVDSIEMSMSFALPTDFVADSMWLWIDGKRVPAEIQDRALASQQYQQVVGYRCDPALLETWGNGSYSLRIFPAASLKSRKIEIEFHHTFDDDALYGAKGLIAASLPIMFTAPSGYVDSAIGFVSAHFSAEGPGTYSVSFPGLGEGTFSAGSSLLMSGSNVAKLDSGVVTTTDPSVNDEFLWVGREPKADVLEAGMSVDLNEDGMRFENEPDTRIILVDIKNKEWDWNTYYNEQAASYGSTASYTAYEVYNVWERAQKYVVLALQQYLKAGQKFNVIIGGKTLTPAFEAPVEATEENIAQAISILLAAAPTGENSTLALLDAARAQAPEGIVVLISDLFRPATYQILTGTDVRTYEISDAGKAFDATMVQIDSLISSSGITMFTINDYYQLSQMALTTGGYNIGGILNRYNIPFTYEVIDGMRVRLPVLPALFGSSNGSGLRNFTMSSEQLSDMVYTIDNNYSNYYYMTSVREAAVDVSVMAKTHVAISPYYYTNSLRTGRMRIAGHLSYDDAAEPVAITIRGKLDGLWFTRTITGIGNYQVFSSSYRPIVDPQWAFRKSEQLAFDNYVTNAAAIKALGKDYHIVTRQTSLLALEPGMELFEDSAWQAQQVSSDAKSASAVPSVRDAAVVDQAEMTASGGASYNATGTGVDFDGVSLDNLLQKSRMAAHVPETVNEQRFAITAAGQMLHLTMAPEQVEAGVTLRLFDLKGRVVATQKLTAKDFHGSKALWNIGAVNGTGHGIYTVQVTGRSIKKVFRITLIGK